MDVIAARAPKDIDLGTETPFKIGRAEVDPISREARFDGQTERLQPQNLKVLIALVRRTGEVVTRGELVDVCWGGRFIGDDVINRSISVLRQFSERVGGFAIETVPKAGYRLVEESTPKSWGWRRRGAIASLIIGLAGAIAAILLVHSNSAPASRPLSIAVLPFTADPADANARKLASLIRSALTQMMSQGAYRVDAVDSIGQDGHPVPNFVISGQVSSTPDGAVATVRMDETAYHAVVFSHDFAAARGSLWSLPEEVGAQVASQISSTEPFFRLEQRHPSDPAVFTTMLQSTLAGLSGVSPLHDYQNGRRVAEDNPDSPVAQAEMIFGTVHVLGDLPLDQRTAAVAEARAAEARALKLAPEFGEGHFAWCFLHSEQRRLECEDQIRQAIRLDPDSTWANEFLASAVLAPTGRNAEAARLAQLSLAHDPYMPVKIANVLLLLEQSGQIQQAAELYSQANRWWPGNKLIAWFRLSGMINRGDFRTAQQFGREAGLSIASNATLTALNGKSLPAIRSACAAAQDMDGIVCMLGLAQLGDLNSAFLLAERLYPSRVAPTLAGEDRIWLQDPDPNDVRFLTGPAAAPLRRDGRFLALARRVSLLNYWRSGRLPDFCTAGHEPICARIEHG